MGYKAYVKVYDEEFYVDTYSGEGFDKVLKKMEPHINKCASRKFIPNYSFQDLKSEIYIMALDGILAFDPDRNVKLSTFLQTHLHNKIISKIKIENKDANDAFAYGEKDKNEYKKIRTELVFSQMAGPGHDKGEGQFEDKILDDNGLNKAPISDYDLIDFETSLIKVSSKLDEKTRKIIELVYFEDYSIQDAAEKVGLTGWAASTRLKKLATRGTFKSIFNQELLKNYDLNDKQEIND